MNKLEVLVNHAYTELIGIVRAFYMHFLPSYLYHALICMIQTEEDAHQR